MSATHSWSGAVAVNARCTRSGRVSGPAPGIVVRGPFAREIPRSPAVLIKPCDGAAGDPVTLPVQLGVHLPDPVDAVVLGMDPLEDLGRRGVADAPGRGRPGLGGVVGARGDLRPGLGEDLTDRLDPVLGAVLVDVVHDHVGGHLIRRSSSAAAKNADAVFKMSLARRSSLTSRSSSAIRFASAVVVPAR